MPHHRVVVLGASQKPQRYSYKAIGLLLEHGYEVVPVHPKLASIKNLPVMANLSQISEPVDTLTLYVGEKASAVMIDEIIALQPQRIIFNPGTESAVLEDALQQAGIMWVKDCTLVMLREGRF